MEAKIRKNRQKILKKLMKKKKLFEIRNRRKRI